MIWPHIQAARTEGRDLRVVFLDLTNAFGSVPHGLLWKAFSYLFSSVQVPPDNISALVKAYFEDVQLCFYTSNYITSCTLRMLAKLNDNLKWARMKEKPSKCRSVSISKGKLVE